MVADPCNATLVPGCFSSSEGYLARMRDNINNDTRGTCGYMLWAPMYHNNAEAKSNEGVTFNMFAFSADGGNQNPDNSVPPGVVYGWGSSFEDSLTLGTASKFPDPASYIVGNANAVVQDARLISACMKMTYTGPMVASEGEFCFVRIPLTAVLGDTPNGVRPVNVDSIFRLSPERLRLGVDTIEIVHRPEAELHELFHETNDSCVVQGDAGAIETVSTLGPTAQLRQVYAFGFAWRSLSDTTPANLTFEFTKNIEWRPSPRSGFVAQVPRVLNNGNKVKEAIRALDATIPNWDKRILDTASSMAGKLSQVALTGVLNHFMPGASPLASFSQGLLM
jgi:hypothetical protein